MFYTVNSILEFLSEFSIAYWIVIILFTISSFAIIGTLFYFILLALSKKKNDKVLIIISSIVSFVIVFAFLSFYMIKVYKEVNTVDFTIKCLQYAYHCDCNEGICDCVYEEDGEEKPIKCYDNSN